MFSRDLMDASCGNPGTRRDSAAVSAESRESGELGEIHATLPKISVRPSWPFTFFRLPAHPCMTHFILRRCTGLQPAPASHVKTHFDSISLTRMVFLAFGNSVSSRRPPFFARFAARIGDSKLAVYDYFQGTAPIAVCRGVFAIERSTSPVVTRAKPRAEVLSAGPLFIHVRTVAPSCHA